MLKINTPIKFMQTLFIILIWNYLESSFENRKSVKDKNLESNAP
jgi:hypothetical protein